MPAAPSDNCYDYPQYWDLAFRDESKMEADFFEAAFQRFAGRPVKHVLEPGCGGGRLVIEMAARGYRTAGFDLSQHAIRYLHKRLKRRKLSASAYVGDMTDFQVDRPVDAIFNTFNTFRHLLSEAAAESHLRAVARALAPGGLFILGLHVMPPDADEEDSERWTAKHGGVRVTVTMRVLEMDWRRRQEVLRFNLSVLRPAGKLKLQTDYPLRIYKVGQLQSLLAKIPELQLCGVYDFWYDLNEPQQLNEEISDTVLVLRRK